jgi:hypothetical protein
MQKQISIVLKSPCKKCLSRWGELRKTNQAHPAGLYCKNCGFWLKWVGNGEELKAVIIVETKIKVNSKTNKLNSGTKEQKSKEIPTVITEAEYMEMIGLGHLNYLDIISPDILSDND